MPTHILDFGGDDLGIQKKKWLAHALAEELVRLTEPIHLHRVYIS